MHKKWREGAGSSGVLGRKVVVLEDIGKLVDGKAEEVHFDVLVSGSVRKTILGLQAVKQAVGEHWQSLEHGIKRRLCNSGRGFLRAFGGQSGVFELLVVNVEHDSKHLSASV